MDKQSNQHIKIIRPNLVYFNEILKDVIFQKTNLFGDKEDGLYMFGKLYLYGNDHFTHVIKTTYTYYGPNKLEDFGARPYTIGHVIQNFKQGWKIDEQETRNIKLKKLGIL